MTFRPLKWLSQKMRIKDSKVKLTGGVVLYELHQFTDFDVSVS